MQRFLSLFIQMLPICLGGGFGLYHSFTWGIITGICFAFFFAIVFRVKEIRVFKKMGIKESWVNIRQAKSLKINASKTVTLERVREILKKMNTVVFYDDFAKGVIKAKSKWGLSWNIITISVSENNQLTEILIESRPWLITQLIDYGSNYQNIKIFESFITSSKSSGDEIVACSDFYRRKDETC